MNYQSLREFWPHTPKGAQVHSQVVDWEHNRYDDSDFYAVVWDGASFTVQQIGSTAYGCYGANYPKADQSTQEAFREVCEVWSAHMLECVRLHRRGQLRALGVPDRDIRAMQELGVMSSKRWEPIVSILKVKKFRSEFRAKIAAQVREWLYATPESRRYDFPLSPKQYECISRY